MLNLLVPQLSDKEKVEQITQEINSMKANEVIFKSLIQSKGKYEVDKSHSSILWVNLEAKNILTVVTNPHCNPCTKMHEWLKHLLEMANNGYCNQYIFTSSDEELEESSKLLIAMYQKMDENAYFSFLDVWYNKRKNKKEDYYKQYFFDKEESSLLAEWQKHKMWTDQAKIKATPTVLFNGYELPEKYKVEDLIYFCNSDL